MWDFLFKGKYHILKRNSSAIFTYGEIETFNWYKESEAEWSTIRSRKPCYIKSRIFRKKSASPDSHCLMGANVVLINPSRSFSSVVRSPVDHDV
jgi:hypothetical protein